MDIGMSPSFKQFSFTGPLPTVLVTDFLCSSVSLVGCRFLFLFVGVGVGGLSGRVHGGCAVWEICTPKPGPLCRLLVVGQKAALDPQNALLYIDMHFVSLFLL
jgi:hypothetical protein